MPVGRAPRLVLMISLATGLRIGAIALTRMADLCVDPEPVVGARDNGPWLRVPAVDGAKFSAKERREGAELVVPLSAFSVALFREALALRRGAGAYVFEGHRRQAAGAEHGKPGVAQAGRCGGLADPGRHGRPRSAAHRCGRTSASSTIGGVYEDEERLIGHAVGSVVARSTTAGAGWRACGPWPRRGGSGSRRS